MKNLITARATRNLALVGISKNSGKTSLLNAILADFPSLKWAVMTTGIDGEEKDLVFKTHKPQVSLHTGMLFCCDAQSLDALCSKIQVLSAFTHSNRKLFLAKALQPLKTQITGPSSVLQQAKLMAHFRALGAQKVLVDGSLDRKSIAMEDAIDALILLVGASYGSIEQIITEVKRLIMLRDLPQAELSSYQFRRLKRADEILIKHKSRWQGSKIESLIQHEKQLMELLERETKALYIPTSFTDSLYEKLAKPLAKGELKIIFRHPECLKLSKLHLQNFLKSCQVTCLIPFKIKAFALNSTAIGKDAVAADDFRQQIRAAFPDETFFDIMEIDNAGS
ncbi:MAG: CobW-like GTP-binding protein [Candidatus Cloacimonetes bacterium]|nr:CobW-like GTP-binding protein [Candidatus Cloacimonadota bacterium]MDY0173094.1 GTP-binding protein [Candidatus Cloacimonadaceae bacterium]